MLKFPIIKSGYFFLTVKAASELTRSQPISQPSRSVSFCAQFRSKSLPRRICTRFYGETTRVDTRTWKKNGWPNRTNHFLELEKKSSTSRVSPDTYRKYRVKV